MNPGLVLAEIFQAAGSTKAQTPGGAWPGSGTRLFFVVLAVELSALALGAAGSRARRRERPRARTTATGGWATMRDLRDLVVSGPAPGRLSLGLSRGKLLATESRHSVVVLGPSQSHKTSGFAVPALLEWEGPVVVTSVKGDILDATAPWRERRGPVWLFDPSGSTGRPTDSWSPVPSSVTWVGARRAAASLIASARVTGLSEGEFWYATAAKLIAPLLFAAARGGRTMADVVAWVDTQEVAEVADLLDAAGDRDAIRAAWATWRRDERQRSSVYTTAETVLEAFADPVADEGARFVDVASLLDGSEASLYICAPAHEQERLAPAFTGLVHQVLATAYSKVTAQGAPLSPPLLAVLDEAANVAPLRDLDSLASTAAGHGIQLVTVWQDMAQINSRYGSRAATVVNNHRAKVILSGISDPATLEHMSSLMGEHRQRHASTTRDSRGARSITESVSWHRLAPVDALRRIRPGEGVLVYGHLPPARIRLRPWFESAILAARARVTDATGRGVGRRRPRWYVRLATRLPFR